MYKEFEQWLDTTLSQGLSDCTVALVFNMYQDGENQWSIELVETATFDDTHEDWACDEVYCDRDNPFIWTEEGQWSDILIKTGNILKFYLENGAYANFLKNYQGIAYGFVDGDLNILHKN